MRIVPDGSLRPSNQQVSRRQFAKGASTAAMAAGFSLMTPPANASETKAVERETQLPLKIGHRAASMRMVGDFDVFKVARQMPGLIGVELQVTSGNPNLRDRDAVRRYKHEAHRWGMIIPSVAGVWDPGVSILRSPDAGINLVQAIRVAEFLGSSVVLAAFFKHNAPDMDEESSYGPVVEVLRCAAPYGADAGVTLGLENSLSPADNKKLVDLVDHANVKVYYDPYNMAHYGYAEEAVPGIRLLDKKRICQVHVKNGEQRIGESGLVDWAAAFEALNEIGYEGWYVFETKHGSHSDVIEDTAENIAFVCKNCRMPVG